jgi:hypothetical protein
MEERSERVGREKRRSFARWLATRWRTEREKKTFSYDDENAGRDVLDIDMQNLRQLL